MNDIEFCECCCPRRALVEYCCGFWCPTHIFNMVQVLLKEHDEELYREVCNDLKLAGLL